MTGDDVLTEDKLESGDIIIHGLSSLSCGRRDEGDGGSCGSKKSPGCGANCDSPLVTPF